MNASTSDKEMSDYLEQVQCLGGLKFEKDQITFEDNIFEPLPLRVDSALRQLYVDGEVFGTEDLPKRVWAATMSTALTKSGIMAHLDYTTAGFPKLVAIDSEKQKVPVPLNWDSVKTVLVNLSPDVGL